MYQSLRTENGSLRGRTGSGEPGLWVLLGGTGDELDSGGLTLTGGSGAVGATAKLARAKNDVRLAAVAGGASVPSSGSPYSSEGGSTRPGSGGRPRDRA